MITYDGAEIPDTILIGVTRGKWPIKLFYDVENSAAEWLDQGNQIADERGKRRVYRVRLEPIEELSYVPPVPARLSTKSVRPVKTKEQHGDPNGTTDV